MLDLVNETSCSLFLGVKICDSRIDKKFGCRMRTSPGKVAFAYSPLHPKSLETLRHGWEVSRQPIFTNVLLSE